MGPRVSRMTLRIRLVNVYTAVIVVRACIPNRAMAQMVSKRRSKVGVVEAAFHLCFMAASIIYATFAQSGTAGFHQRIGDVA